MFFTVLSKSRTPTVAPSLWLLRGKTISDWDKASQAAADKPWSITTSAKARHGTNRYDLDKRVRPRRPRSHSSRNYPRRLPFLVWSGSPGRRAVRRRDQGVVDQSEIAQEGVRKSLSNIKSSADEEDSYRDTMAHHTSLRRVRHPLSARRGPSPSTSCTEPSSHSQNSRPYLQSRSGIISTDEASAHSPSSLARLSRPQSIPQHGHKTLIYLEICATAFDQLGMTQQAALIRNPHVVMSSGTKAASA